MLERDVSHVRHAGTANATDISTSFNKVSGKSHAVDGREDVTGTKVSLDLKHMIMEMEAKGAMGSILRE